MAELEYRDVGKKMLEAEDAVKRHTIIKGNKINYQKLWKDFKDCYLEYNINLEIVESLPGENNDRI